MAEEKKVNELYRTMFVVWGGLLLSQFLFLVIGYTTKPDLLYVDVSKPVLGSEPTAIIVMAVIAVSVIVTSFVVRSSMISAAITARDPQKLQSAYVTGMAMADGVSLLGLVAAFVFDYQYFLVFVVLGALTIFFHRPKMSNIVAATFEDKI